MGGKKIQIREFPLHEMKPNCKITAIGSSGSGKSKLIENIINVYKHKFPIATIISGSEDNNKAYSKIFPDLYIYTDYDETIMENIEKRQKVAMSNPEINPWQMVIVDDCSYDQKYMKKPIFQKFYKLGRHWNMMMILAIQYCNDIPPAIKSNIDYTFIYRDPNDENRKKLYKNYAGIVGSYSDFCDLMDQLTGDYCALVINNRAQSNNKEDCVFYYKARIFDKINFGCAEYKQWSEARYDENYVMEL